MSKEDENGFTFNVDTLDITTDDINWEEYNEGLYTMENEDFIKEFIEKGIDLRKHSQEVEDELRGVEISSIDDCNFIFF